MRTLIFAQGTSEWLDARCGLVTSSNAKRIMTPGKMEFSTQAKDYACELIAEKLIGGRDPWKMDFETADMRRGTYTEHEARNYWQLVRDLDVTQVGLCIHDNERWAASPDGLVGEEGGIELKCPAPKTQVRWLIDGIVPVEHQPQVHHALIVTGREWWDWMSYTVGLPPLLIRVTPNQYTETLRGYLERFNSMLDDMLARIIEQRDRAIDEAISREGDQLPDDVRSLVPASAQTIEEPQW